MNLEPATQLLQEKIHELRLQHKIELQHGDEGFASAPSNIALLKYWGKIPGQDQLPENSSLSFTLGSFRAFTKVSILGQAGSGVRLFPHEFWFDGKSHALPAKMAGWLDAILEPYAPELSLKIETSNNFPEACGIASSAAGYGALVGAIADLLQLPRHLSSSELHQWLTHWARRGSGSACRSIVQSEEPSFVAWQIDEEHPQSWVEPLATHPRWQELQHCVFLLNDSPKEISSSLGHQVAHTSPFFSIRKENLKYKWILFEKALQEFDFELAASLSEEDALMMHAVMQTSEPKVCYFGKETAQVISEFLRLRKEEKLQAFWTLDAGPNVHILFMPEARPLLAAFHKHIQTIMARKVEILVNQFHFGLLLGKARYEQLQQHEILTGQLL